MTYELVKYKYGTLQRYTAFCLTPRLAKPKTSTAWGVTFTTTNRGAASPGACHFQTPETAAAWLSARGQDASGLDWALLPGTKRRLVSDCA